MSLSWFSLGDVWLSSFLHGSESIETKLMSIPIPCMQSGHSSSAFFESLPGPSTFDSAISELAWSVPTPWTRRHATCSLCQRQAKQTTRHTHTAAHCFALRSHTMHRHRPCVKRLAHAHVMRQASYVPPQHRQHAAASPTATHCLMLMASYTVPPNMTSSSNAHRLHVLRQSSCALLSITNMSLPHQQRHIVSCSLHRTLHRPT